MSNTNFRKTYIGKYSARELGTKEWFLGSKLTWRQEIEIVFTITTLAPSIYRWHVIWRDEGDSEDYAWRNTPEGLAEKTIRDILSSGYWINDNTMLSPHQIASVSYKILYSKLDEVR